MVYICSIAMGALCQLITHPPPNGEFSFQAGWLWMAVSELEVVRLFNSLLNPPPPDSYIPHESDHWLLAHSVSLCTAGFPYHWHYFQSCCRFC